MGVLRIEPARAQPWSPRSLAVIWRSFDLQLTIYALLLASIGLAMAYSNSVESGGPLFARDSTFVRGLNRPSRDPDDATGCVEPRARRPGFVKGREHHCSFSSSVPSPSPSHSRFTFFLSTSSAAASASAFSLRASSRSSTRMRLVVASEARPSSAKARRHCSYSASSSPSRSRRS